MGIVFADFAVSGDVYSLIWQGHSSMEYRGCQIALYQWTAQWTRSIGVDQFFVGGLLGWQLQTKCEIDVVDCEGLR